ncbi:hypothetical protein [Virgibacillus proomii]|uniref:hypothetical protein n=1 Tax=Virgibacillus proomii TaxID=84407 RepID=UPI000986EFDA|nr:hypothetical protein [Virgibacillus proomii]
MSVELIVFLVILFIFTLIATLRIFKQEENKLKQYEQLGDTVENEMNRSKEYETQSLKSNLPILSWIYGVTIILGLAALFIYMF